MTGLEGSRKNIVYELNELETKWNQLEQMIKEDSRKLVVDGEAILDQVNQIKNSHFDFNLECDTITLTVEQGPAWKPSSAVLVHVSGSTQMTSFSQMGAIENQTSCSRALDALPKTQSKPQLSSIANKKFIRTQGVDLKDIPWVVRFIDNKLFIGMQNMIDIFDLNLKIIHQWSNNAWGCVNDVAGLPDRTSVLVCYNGLFHVDSNGKEIIKIDSGNYRSGPYHDGKLYVYDCDSNTIIVYEYSRLWKKQTTFQSPVKHGFNTLSISDTTITICSQCEHKLYIMNVRGEVIHTYGTHGSRDAGELDDPVLCQEDEDGAMLLAEFWNNRLQILDEQRKWSIVNMQPEVKTPMSAIYVNHVIYVVSKRDLKLYSYKLS